MKLKMVVVESLEISNLYIKNKEIMNGFICTYNFYEMYYVNAKFKWLILVAVNYILIDIGLIYQACF